MLSRERTKIPVGSGDNLPCITWRSKAQLLSWYDMELADTLRTSFSNDKKLRPINFELTGSIEVNRNGINCLIKKSFLVPELVTMVKGFAKLVLKPQQEREAEILRKSVLSHFQHLPDPRVERTKDHNLVAIVTIAILAVLSGANGFVAIATYGKAKQAWLETFLDLSDGIPSQDPFGRVFAVLDPRELPNSFLGWVACITEKLNLELIHVDGKTAHLL